MKYEKLLLYSGFTLGRDANEGTFIFPNIERFIELVNDNIESTVVTILDYEEKIISIDDVIVKDNYYISATFNFNDFGLIVKIEDYIHCDDLDNYNRIYFDNLLMPIDYIDYYELKGNLLKEYINKNVKYKKKKLTDEKLIKCISEYKYV